jgi:hypothetical protein
MVTTEQIVNVLVLWIGEVLDDLRLVSFREGTHLAERHPEDKEENIFSGKIVLLPIPFPKF